MAHLNYPPWRVPLTLSARPMCPPCPVSVLKNLLFFGGLATFLIIQCLTSSQILSRLPANMDHSSLGKLPLDILRFIWDLVSGPSWKANPASFDCGHTAHGARDPTSKRLDNTLMKCCRELYHCGSMMLYGGRDLKFHEAWCFRRFIHSLSGPLPLQLAMSVEIRL